ncbi:DUF2383 domain-containing protein [Paenibacillus silviterrae]|uniref:DUF2383 domain-containing protein n=1 Tax=Paenibacillus silviterrae TaxID=3242194 RepID=UPI00254356CA|nr:DUF2383 domain-containing protein [Paenibacillus chinjuensis]
MQATKDKTVTMLNDYLKGVYMGVHSYETYIQHVKSPEVKRAFQEIQQSHKKEAADLAERIQNLNGTAADGPGLIDSIAGTISNKWKGVSEETAELIQEAIKGERMGIEQSEKLLQQELDDTSRKLIERIRQSAENHIKQLEKHIV